MKGSFIVASNHHSLLDFPLIYASLPGCTVRKIVAPAARDFFFEKWLLRFFVRSTFNAFPLDRYGNFLEGLNVCARLLKSGRAIILFPEGTRSRGGELQPFKSGIGMLSLELNVPIVPAYIKGADRVLPKGKLVPRPRKVELIFGEPVPPQQYAAFRKSKRNHEIYKQMIDEIRKRIEALREVA